MKSIIYDEKLGINGWIYYERYNSRVKKGDLKHA